MRDVVYSIHTDKDVGEKEIRVEVKKDEEEILKQEKQEKLDKARKALESITNNSKAPIFCPKHGTSRIGNEYTCGCQI